jgi:hypothetical protein
LSFQRNITDNILKNPEQGYTPGEPQQGRSTGLTQRVFRLSLDSPVPLAVMTEGWPVGVLRYGVTVLECPDPNHPESHNCEKMSFGPDGLTTATGARGWYFANRGRVIKSGYLVNQHNGDCLRHWSAQSGDLVENPCTSNPLNVWSLYENGLLMNGETHRCMKPSSPDGTGNIRAEVGCQNFQDSRWEETGHSNTGSFLLRNWQSGQCLGYQRRRVRGRTTACVDDIDLRYKWEPSGWVEPEGVWRLVGANEDGSVDHTYVTRTESSQTMTETTTITVGVSIEKGVIFSGATVSTQVSQALALAWSSSTATEERISTSCRSLEDGSGINGRNFLWQWRQTMNNPSQEHTILWDAIYTKCTDNELLPKCPPFTGCTDPACTKCVLFSEM